MDTKTSARFRCGFTTGTCAQAAAKGAAVMLLTQELLNEVEVETPRGVRLNLKLIDQKIGKKKASCAVVKDAGDDPDVTDGAKIYAEVKFSPQKGIQVRGGEGVGRVTKPGLSIGVGEYAINPVPRGMIIKEVSRYLPKEGGLEVVISVPGGEELAKHTFNPRLGIVGGISIIGTTGIVEPKSTDAYKASLSLQLDVLKALKLKKAVLVLGYVGEKFAKEVLKIDDDSIVKIGDHVGFMLKECVRKKIKDILLIGHIGKLIKIAKGQFNTHSKFGDNRIETIVHFAKRFGARKEVIRELSRQTTAEATIDILRKNSFLAVFEKIAHEAVLRINEFLDPALSKKGLRGGRRCGVDNQLRINCILLSLRGEVLAAYPKEGAG